MTGVFRLKTTADATKKDEVKKVIDSQFYKRCHASQLNEMEWSAIFVPCFLFFNLKGIDCTWAATLAAWGQIAYFWPRAFQGHIHEGGMDPPPYLPGAIMRYVSLGMIVNIMWQQFF